MKNPVKSLWIWTSVFFGLFLSWPSLLSAYPTSFYFKFPLYAALLAAVFWFIYRVFQEIRPRLVPKLKSWFALRPPRTLRQSRLFFYCMLVLFLLCAVPVFLAFYPGMFGADAPLQLNAFCGGEPLTTHHPLLHTTVLSLIVLFGENVLHNANAGVALYVFFVQIFFCACALSCALNWLFRKGLPAWILCAAGLLLWLNPFVQVLLVYTTKDIPFTAALLLFGVSLAQALFPAKWRNGIGPNPGFGRVFFWGLIMALLRNQGVYMLLGALLLVWFGLRKSMPGARFQKLVRTLASLTVISWLCMSLLPSLLGVQKGDMREMFAVPIHQMSMATVGTEDVFPANISEDTRQEALEYFDNLPAYSLDAFSADNAKYQFLTGKVKANPLGFAEAYLDVVFSDFTRAISYYAYLTAPYIDMRISPYNALAVLPSYTEIADAHGIFQESLLPQLKEEYKTLLSHSSHRTACPFWLRLFDPAWSLYFLVFLCGYALFFKKNLCRIVVLFPILYVLTMLLGPVSLLRYSFVYLFEWPFLLGCFWLSFFPEYASKHARRKKPVQKEKPIDPEEEEYHPSLAGTIDL